MDKRLPASSSKIKEKINNLIFFFLSKTCLYIVVMKSPAVHFTKCWNTNLLFLEVDKKKNCSCCVISSKHFLCLNEKLLRKLCTCSLLAVSFSFCCDIPCHLYCSSSLNIFPNNYTTSKTVKTLLLKKKNRFQTDFFFDMVPMYLM